MAAKSVAPQFIDFISGNTIEEVEASIALAITKTAEITTEMQEVQQQARELPPRDERGRFAVPGIPEPELDFTKLSYSDYVKNRDQIMRNSQDKGIFS